MYLREKMSGDLVEITDLSAMIDPCRTELEGCFHAGEEMQERTSFEKGELEFPSGEALPQCWIDANYRSLH